MAAILNDDKDSTLTTVAAPFISSSSVSTTSTLMKGLNLNSPTIWLALYFFFNLSLTLYNKSVLIHFPFPYTLTAIHAFWGSMGSWVLVRYQAASSVPSLSLQEWVLLIMFSVLYTVNIVVSNASLRLVTIPFHQVVRAATPFFTLVFSAIILQNRFRITRRKVISLIPVVAGVGLATYGDYYFTTLGFLLTLFGTVLAALKTITTHLILVNPSSSHTSQPTLPLHSPVGYSTVPLPPSSEKDSMYYRHRTAHTDESFMMLSPSSSSSSISSLSQPPPHTQKLKLSPLHLLYLLSPLAFIQATLLAHFTGELDHVSTYLSSLSTSTDFGAAADAALLASSSNAASSFPGAGGYLTRIGEWVHLDGLGVQLHGPDNPLTHIHFHFPTFIQGWKWSQTSSSSSSWWGWGKGAIDPRFWLALNGFMAFWLNVVSFNANRRIGALGMTVAANVKQVLIILLAVLMFDLTITAANALGVVLTIVGGAAYGFVEYRERKERLLREKVKVRTG